MSQSETLATLKQAFLTIERLQKKVADLQQIQSEQAQKAHEPIAIIGMAGRFPNGANSPQAFWEMLRDGRDGITEVPAERWDADLFYDPDPQRAGKIATRWGGFLTAIEAFDARFFGIAPREAANMDPQQRLLLEVAWEALETAGQPPDRLAGTATGVYIGMLNSEYAWLQFRDLAALDAYSGTGTSHSVASGRLSYFLGLHGPSVTLDTACSSSLVAIHLACQALRSGECQLALAGGVSVMLSPLSLMPFTRMGLLAADGRCKVLDARADGFGGGEACALIVLKRLSAAQADGDPILAVIHGSAVNQDGRTNVLSAPNGLAQAAVIRQALANARLDPSQISYIEMHGTGTALGDPIEVDALREIFGRRPNQEGGLVLGALKSHIGHTGGAAGVAGVIKAILAMQNELIPANLHFESLNPHINLTDTPFIVPTTAEPWPAGEQPRWAGISAFGWSGTNAHLILSSPPAADQGHEESHLGSTTERPAYLLPLSARSPEALGILAGRYADHLLASEDEARPLADVIYGAAVRRSHHPYRLAVTGRSTEELAGKLRSFGDERADDHLPVRDGRRRKLVFVFSPHGSQWAGMGRQLWATSAVFREKLFECEAALRAYQEWSVIERLLAEGPNQSWLDEIDVLQPTLFALQVAVAAVWQGWGVEPAAIVGHSMGEVAAAHVAGVLTLDEAARIICRRTQLLRSVSGQGAMGMVELSFEQAETAIAPFNGRLSIAVSNSPRSTIIAGEPEALESLFDRLQEQEVFCGWGVADVASHSPEMASLLPALRQALGTIWPAQSRYPIYSTVSGELRDGRQFDIDYWLSHLSRPVRFAQVVGRLAGSGHDLFLEIAPGPVLATAIEEGLLAQAGEGDPPAGWAVLSSMRRGEADDEAMLAALGQLYTLGYPVDWSRLYPHGRLDLAAPLPTYPWQHERFWLSADTRQLLAGAARPDYGLSAGQPSLLGRPISVATSSGEMGRRIWETLFDRRLLPLPFEHRLFGRPILPASAVIEMGLQAAVASSAAFEGKGSTPVPLGLADLAFHKALWLKEDSPWTVTQLILEQPGGGFALYSQQQDGEITDGWQLQASGRLFTENDRVEAAAATAVAEDAPLRIDLPAIRRHSLERDSQSFYSDLAAQGAEYGSGLQLLSRCWRSEPFLNEEAGRSAALGQLELSASLRHEIDRQRRQGGYWAMHLALIDAGLQLFADLVNERASEVADGRVSVYALAAIDRVAWLRPGCVASWAYAELEERDGLDAYGRVVLADDAGQSLFVLDGVRFAQVTGTPAESLADWLYTIRWQTSPLPARLSDMSGRWLIFSDQQGIGEALAGELKRGGDTAILVEANPAAVGPVALAADHWQVRPQEAGDYHDLLASLLAPDQPGPTRFVYLWGIDSPNELAGSPAQLLADAAAPLPYLVQAVKARDPEGIHPIWLVTSGAQPVAYSTGPLALQAGLWGMGYVIAEEHHELWGGLIDLDPAAAAHENAGYLLAHLASGEDEDRVAFRNGQRYVARLEPLLGGQTEPLTGYTWRPDGAYLISGGLGEIALQVAHWAVRQGARRLVLLGRSPLPPRSEWDGLEPLTAEGKRTAAIRALEALGASVHWAAVDVADADQLAAFLATYSAEGWPPIRGIIHSAAVIEDRLLVELNGPSIERVARPKAQGAENLLALSSAAGLALDFILLFSSSGSVMGAAGQGNYAAANAYVDALAHSRQRPDGPPILSINWGFWQDLGFANTPGGRRIVAHMARAGLIPFHKEQALAILGYLLGRAVAGGTSGLTQVVTLRLDWEQWQAHSQLVGLPPLLRAVAQSAAGQPAGGHSPAAATGSGWHRVDIRQELEALEPGPQRRQKLQGFLRQQLADVLRLDAQFFDLETPLGSLGIDSLTAIELRNRLERGLGLHLSATLAWNYPTIAAMTPYLADKMNLALDATARIEAAGPSTVDDDILDILQQAEALSDEELWQLLVGEPAGGGQSPPQRKSGSSQDIEDE